MRISAFSLVLGYVIISSAPTFAEAAEPKARTSLITESLFASATERSKYGIPEWHYSNRENTNKPLWDKLLLSVGLPVDKAPKEQNYWRSEYCLYDTAITLLQQIRIELGAENAYQKIWADNQNKTFSACERKSNNTPPIKPDYANLPARAESDFNYQLASWYFYQADFEKALPLYQEVAKSPDAPVRPYANYMVARTLYKLNRNLEAYHKIGDILADPTLKPVHNIAGNYRFVIGGYNNDELAKQYLQWLLSVVKFDPSKTQNPKQAYADYFDAMEHLDRYFPLYNEGSETKDIDWWLNDESAETLTSSHMKAVQELAKTDELVDWMQAKWAYNVFDTDWLWALHKAKTAYWEQNHHIVAHAWQRWQKGDGLEWLEIAIKRVQPADSLAKEILNAAEPYFSVSSAGESEEYNNWLASTWQNSIRLHLGNKDYDKAYMLLKEYNNRRTLFDNQYSVSDLQENVLRWLVYAGELEQARKFLVLIQSSLSNKLKHWQVLLATDLSGKDWDEIATYSRNEFYNELWEEMLNVFSAESLYHLANSKNGSNDVKPLLARTALTRAFLLQYKDKIEDYAILTAKLNPSIYDALLSTVATHKDEDFINFLLRQPRFRPAVYINIPEGYYARIRGSSNLNTNEIDSYNVNNNNWWCRYERGWIQQRIFNAAKIIPAYYPYSHEYMNRFFDDPEGEAMAKEMAPHIAVQKKLLAEHPYHKMVDEAENKALEAIPSGPEYLSKAVIARESPSKWDRWLAKLGWKTKYPDNDANLHYAVRTTRYGCRRDGSHAAYSRQAFELLHRKYPDSTWTKATPYWFSFGESDPKYHPTYEE